MYLLLYHTSITSLYSFFMPLCVLSFLAKSKYSIFLVILTEKLLSFNFTNYQYTIFRRIKSVTAELSNSIEESFNYSLKSFYILQKIGIYWNHIHPMHNSGNSYFSCLAIRQLNDQMMLFDRSFIIPEGIPGKPGLK